jgi:hypothetical protein
MRILAALLLAASMSLLAAQAPAAPPPADPLASLGFLLGTWTAKTNAAAGYAGAEGVGTYTFHRDLAGHAVTRSSSVDNCKGPKDFDCSHQDQLTIFSDPHDISLSALYLDSEGHVIHYTITTPDPHTAIFLSQSAPSQHAPVYRLIYHLEGDGPKAIMSGKFQMAAPGSDDFHSYLEWSGTRQ